MSTSDRHRVIVQWSLSAVAGAGAAVVTALLSSDPNNPRQVSILLGAFAIGAIPLGLTWPVRPWRWPVAMLVGLTLAQPIRDLSASALLTALVALPLGALVLLPPALLGAYLGSTIRRGVLRHAGWHAMRTGTWVLVAMMAGLAPLLFASEVTGLLFSSWALTTGTASFFAVRRTRERPFAAAAATALGPPLAVLARILIDTVRDPTSHTMAPFEILVALLIAIPAAAAGGTFALGTLPTDNRSG